MSPFWLAMDSVLTVAAVTETLGSLGGGKAMLEGTHKITVKVCMKPKFSLMTKALLTRKSRRRDVPWSILHFWAKAFKSESNVFLKRYSVAVEFPGSATQTLRQMRAVCQVRFFQVDVHSM